jgi:hypothetical protein
MPLLGTLAATGLGFAAAAFALGTLALVSGVPLSWKR